MGGYNYKPSRISPTGSSLQLWNGYSSGSNTVDMQSFDVFDYPFSDSKDVYPFQIGSGNIAESIGLNLFDFTATARSSDLISEIVDPSKFGSRSFSYGLLNSTTNLFYNVTSSNLVVSISPVPEPATWAMMLVGFGMIGASTRYRRRSSKTTYA
ncbi:PEP-CTERM sorting domain-containing protein [Sphingomonas sp. CFBP 8760]|nr:PEP-CTERM sorting domain-containing protein [Sphingomonas sp. CFBP 8760]